MNMVDAYNAIGIEVTEDMSEIKRAFRKKYAFLSKKIATDRKAGKDVTKSEKKLQELNQAFNYFRTRESNLREIAKQARNALSMKEQLSYYPDFQRDMIISSELESMELEHKKNISKNFIEDLKKSIDIQFKEIEPAIETEEVTLGVYLRGGHILIGKEMYSIPQGFEGVYATTNKDMKLQFIHIKIKTSAMFNKIENGDLILLKSPTNYKLEKDGFSFTFSNVDFNFTKEDLKKTEKEIISLETDIPIYGAKKNICIHVSKNTTPQLYGEILNMWR